MPAPSTSSFHLRLTAEQRLAIEELAERERISAEQAVIRAVERALRADLDEGSERAVSTKEDDLPEGTPFCGLAGLLDGVGGGPEDLSANGDYLADLGAAGRS